MLIPETLQTTRYQYGIKKYLSELLGERYDENKNLIDRLSAGIRSDLEYSEFMKLMLSAYDGGYRKCVMDHRDLLKSHGLHVEVN